MSLHTFNPKGGPILVEAEATGPARSVNLRLLLDTGATTSLISVASAVYLGLDPAQPLRQIPMITGSRTEIVPVVALTRFGALGQNYFGFPVIAHALPAGSATDGLLGLDFLRGHLLRIDFRAGQITLS